MVQMERKTNGLPPGPEEVNFLRRTISQDLIRIQTTPDPKEIWGVATLDGLPFYFRATKRSGSRDVRLVAAGEGAAVSETYKTNWWSHAPYTPFTFRPPVLAGQIEDGHREYFLRALGVSQELIDKRTLPLDQLYRNEIERQRDSLEKIAEKYTGNPEFGAAVIIASEEKSSGTALLPDVEERF